MLETTTFNKAALTDLSRKNFEKHESEIHRKTDRMFAWLMGIQYVLAIAFALIVSPRTWTGANAQTHPHVWLAILLGGALAAYPIFLAIKRPGEMHTRHVIAVSQALFSALLIHLTGGRIETHFHVFGSLAFLAFYRDWRVLITASAIVAVDHFVRGAWFPFSVYGVSAGAEWRFLEHAGWVLFEDAFLILACVHGIREMRSMAQRQAELQLAKEEIEAATASISQQSAVLNSVLIGMSDGVIVADAQGKFLHFNPAAEKILGQGSHDAPLEKWSEIYGLYSEGSETPYPTQDLPLAKALRGECVDYEQIRVKRQLQGDEVWVEITARPLLNLEGEQRGGMVVFRDVTERRRILLEMAQAREQAERANKAKSEFLSRMSHELRTPMNSILGFGQLLQMEDLTEDQIDSTNHIVTAGTHLLKLINEVLDISRIEAGRLTISKEPVDIVSVIREVTALLQPLANQKNVTVTLVDPPTPEVFAVADHQRLIQVTLNLVSNAIKYNVDAGKVQIEVRTVGDTIRLLVQDTGIGISPEKEALIFTPFERLGAESTAVEGTGLGLALSQRLTEAMGGQIGLERCEWGTCFYVELPAAQSPVMALESSGWQDNLSVHVPVDDSSKVLLIEDNPANIRLVEKILNNRPEYSLLVATHAQQGLDMAAQHVPDVVLLDLNLPDFDGQEVLQKLRENPALKHIPVIVVSADATESQIETLLADGALAYLTKPLDVSEFLSVLANTCTSLERKSA
jgi:two-component system, sensor histidine kinase and response regulator